jgi:hypothetical protein
VATYIVINEHAPDQCEPMEASLDHVPEHLKGKDFYCTCPFGKHGYYLIVDGGSSEQVVQGLPGELLIGNTRLEQLEVFRLPS